MRDYHDDGNAGDNSTRNDRAPRRRDVRDAEMFVILVVMIVIAAFPDAPDLTTGVWTPDETTMTNPSNNTAELQVSIVCMILLPCLLGK